MRLKKRICALTAAVLLAACLAVPSQARTYPDLPTDHWAYQAMDRAFELGIISGVEEDISAEEGANANYEDTMDFVERTKVDAIAPAIGTAHGVYKGVPKLNFDLVERLGKEPTPVVIHGGTGLSAETFARLIALGGRKINISTLVKNAYLDKTKELVLSGEKYAPIPFDTEVYKAVKEAIKIHLEVFSGRRTTF